MLRPINRKSSTRHSLAAVLVRAASCPEVVCRAAAAAAAPLQRPRVGSRQEAAVRQDARVLAPPAGDALHRLGVDSKLRIESGSKTTMQIEGRSARMPAYSPRPPAMPSIAWGLRGVASGHTIQHLP
jgi:hypothetical protein